MDEGNQRAGKTAQMDGFERRKEQSKQRIRRAAWALFGQFGVERVTIADIARKAGVSPATIYNNFEGKDALAREFVAAAIEQLVQQAENALSVNRPYPAKIAAFAQFIAARAGPPGSTQVVDDTVYTRRVDLLNDPEIAEIRARAKERLADLLLDLVREGQAQGQVHTDVSDEAFRIYLKAFMDLFTDPRLQSRFAQEPRLVEDLGRMMVAGLGGQGKTDPQEA
jgi:AcrR family transcriptional regulator